MQPRMFKSESLTRGRELCEAPVIASMRDVYLEITDS